MRIPDMGIDSWIFGLVLQLVVKWVMLAHKRKMGLFLEIG